MLNHILVPQGLMGDYRLAEIHNEGLGDEPVGFAEIRDDPVSYHAPMLADFDLP